MQRRRSEVPAKARRLLDLPNIGPATALDLVKLGIFEPEALAGRDPDKLYRALCKIDGVRHDPCVIDVLYAVVSYANGEPARPWWSFTAERKRRTSA